ncbi:MAG: caspase family protein [Pseudomonadota bacterium]|nr:caspase family protein [Pseudomonadota bacterium]
MAALIVLARPAAADDLGDCSGMEPDTVLVACSAIIGAGTHPRLAEAYANRAWAHWRSGDFDRALADSGKAVDIDPNLVEAHVQRALAHWSKDDPANAIASYDIAIRLDPGRAPSFHNRGIAYQRQGELELAIADFDRAINLDPQNAYTYFSRGTAFETAGQFRQALDDFRSAVGLLPPSDAWYEKIRSRAGEMEEKLAAARAEAGPTAETQATETAPAANLPTPPGKRVALVIGNSAYENVRHLVNPEHDAGDLAALLASLGFEVDELHDLGRVAMEEALGAFSDKSTDAEIAIVFFAGHGVEVDHRNYLIPVDAVLETVRRIPFETVSLDHVMAALDGVKGLRIVLLDACRNNPFVARAAGASRSLGRGLSGVEAASETLVSFSAKEGSVASDGVGRNSPYTAALLENFRQPGLEIGLLFRKVRDSVLAATDLEQEPYISTSLSSDPIYLVPPAVGTGPQPVPPQTSLQARVMSLLVPVSLAGEVPSQAIQDDFAASAQDSVFFYVGEAVLPPEGQVALDTQARWLLANPKVRVRVYGNADEREGDALVLGAQRAKAVRDYLLGAGVPPEQVGSTTHGLDRPAGASSDEASWALNRQVQTRLVSVSRD